mgnify:CR=1 FL=1
MDTSGVTRIFYKVGMSFRKHTPEILTGLGIAGGIATVVVACKQTTKLSPIVEEHKKNIDAIHEVRKENDEVKYTEKDYKKDLTTTYVQTGIKLTKLYSPAIGLGAASIACILGGHNVLSKRNIALTAAYTAIDNGFKEYRSRVAERFGDKIEKQIRYGIKEEKKYEEADIQENVDAAKELESCDPGHLDALELDFNPSEFCRYYDETCAGWQNDSSYNLEFLLLQQRTANDMLRKRGYLFLNEVYDLLGIPDTQAAHVVGWVYRPKDPNHHGDNFVDFGIFKPNCIMGEDKRRFVNGYENVILLDFNVDGTILDKFI